jgi:hypothetical protein
MNKQHLKAILAMAQSQENITWRKFLGVIPGLTEIQKAKSLSLMREANNALQHELEEIEYVDDSVELSIRIQEQGKGDKRCT